MPIINPRGTNGAGKTYLVNRITALYPKHQDFYLEGRKRPIYSKHTRPKGRALVTLGHYETPTGGCDTLPGGLAQIYQLLDLQAKQDQDIIFEGMLPVDDVVNTVKAHQRWGLRVIWLDETIETCIASVRSRREEAGKVDKWDAKRTMWRFDRGRKFLSRLKDSGVPVVRLNREAAFEKCREWLEV